MALGVKDQGDLDRYFEEAKSWDFDRARAAERQRRIASAVGAGGVLFGLAMLGWHVAEPLRSVELFGVCVDKLTGGVDVMRRCSGTGAITDDEDCYYFFLYSYVRA